MSENEFAGYDMFDGVSEEESVDVQLNLWVAGFSLHNPVIDDCCPDYSCCSTMRMSLRDRVNFTRAYNDGDLVRCEQILDNNFMTSTDQLLVGFLIQQAIYYAAS